MLYYLSQRKIKLRAAFFYAGDSIVSPGINWFLHSSGFIQLSSNRSWSLTRLVVIFIDSVDWLSVVSSFGSILMYFLLCCILFEWFCYVHSYRLQHTITKNSLFVQSLCITSVCSQLGMVYLFCRWHTVNRAVFLLFPFRQNVDNPHIKNIQNHFQDTFYIFCLISFIQRDENLSINTCVQPCP